MLYWEVTGRYGANQNDVLLIFLSNPKIFHLFLFSERGMLYSFMVRILMIGAERNQISSWDAFRTILYN